MIDYTKIGLKVGLECHQQLATKKKLFCACKPDLTQEEPEITFMRRLRPTQSEFGQIDPAAFFEFQKGVKIIYEANTDTSCLVEMDEEPPRELNKEALEIALTSSLMMNAISVDEVHVMRKVVIDGSNTTGFQRTCIVAMNGCIYVDGKKIPIQHIGLEEDAARKTGSKDLTLHYRIDRLGIPLIEVTTAPVIYSPKEAERVALDIGRILRATRKVRRGLGTIRQDLNVSITNGVLVEIKGVQQLDLISKVVEYEVLRQINLIEIMNELQRRGVKEAHIKGNIIDITSIFSKKSFQIVSRAIEKGKNVFAVKLPSFSGLLGKELAPNLSFGTEMADRAKFWGRVGGILHTDELSFYGATLDEISKITKIMKASSQDAVVLVADSEENAIDALRAIVERAKIAVKKIPEETRVANIDGTTRYMRPRPGAARMYPETDVPPISITQNYLKKLRSKLPELPEDRITILVEKHGINKKLAKQLQDSEYDALFDTILSETNMQPTFVAATLTETFKALRRDSVNMNALSENQIVEVFSLVDSGKTSKEAIPEIVTWLTKHKDTTSVSAIEALNLFIISENELEGIVDKIIQMNEETIAKKGNKAFGFLMGQIMRKYRGKVKTSSVSRIIKQKLASL